WRARSGRIEEGLEIQTEVIPFGVEGFDQGDFLGSPPLFDFLFTRDSRTDAGVGFEPDELADVVPFCEAGEYFLLVLADAESQVAGHTEVEDAGLAGHEVNVEGALHAGGIVTEET